MNEIEQILANEEAKAIKGTYARAVEIVKSCGFSATHDQDELIARITRFLEGDKADDAGYWMLNYAQAVIGRNALSDTIDALRIELAEARVQIARFELTAAEMHLEHLENPYG